MRIGPAVTGLLISGFKAFNQLEDDHYIPIKPITLIFGQNAAGKSSIMHALAWMHHLHLGGSPDANEMLLTGNLVNLGGFNSLRHRSVAGFKAVPSVGLSFELTDPVRSFGPVRGYLPPIDYPYEWRLKYDTGDLDPKTGEPFPKGPRLTQVTVAFGSSQFTLGDLDEDGEIQSIQCVLSKEMTQEILGRYSPSFPRADECTAFQEEVSDHLWDLEFTLRGLALRCKGDPQWDGEITPPVRDFLGNLQAVVAQVEVAIDQFFGRSSRAGMVYLGPWRRIPEEADLAKVSRASDRPEMRFWASLFDDQTRTEVNRWLARFECDIEIDKRQQIDRDLIFRRLREVWNGPLEEPDSVLEKLEELFTEDTQDDPSELVLRIPGLGTPISPGNTGVGISQIIPVIVAALEGKGNTILIEQPELHLHPKLQAEVGDLLIQAAVGSRGPGQCLIVETHSEHLILRLLRRVRESSHAIVPREFPLSKNEVSVVYIGRALDPEGKWFKEHATVQGFFDHLDEQVRNGEISTDQAARLKWLGTPIRVTPLPINDNGDFDVKWPEGFFEDRLKEIFSKEELESWYEKS